MTKFCVYDNGKPAKSGPCKVDKSFENNEFDDPRDAAVYVNKWLGKYTPGLSYICNKLVEGKCEFDYSGYSDIITVKEEEFEPAVKCHDPNTAGDNVWHVHT